MTETNGIVPGVSDTMRAIGERYGVTPPAASDDARTDTRSGISRYGTEPPTHDPELAAVDERIDTALKNEACSKKDHPDHARVMREVTELFRQRYADEAAQEARDYLFKDAPVEELAKAAGLIVELPPNHGLDPVHGAHLLAWTIQEQLPAVTVNGLVEWMYERKVMRGGVVDVYEDDFKRDFAGKLARAQMDLLVRWWREEVMAG